VLGSVATGTARDDSDIDVALFMCPLEPYIVPAESIWRPDDDTFHSIFSEDITAGPDDLQLDIHRYDLSLWRSPGHEWPEPIRAELATGWIAFDRDGEVPTLVAEHVTYDDGHRLHQLDEALVWLDQHLDRDKLVQRWETLEAVVAHDRLQAAYEYLVQASFAYNGRWQPWRNREIEALQSLAWLPSRNPEDLAGAAISTGHDRSAYDIRSAALQKLADRLTQRLQADGLYGSDPIGEAFIRLHDEPGRSWNLDEWNERHRQRYPRPW